MTKINASMFECNFVKNRVELIFRPNKNHPGRVLKDFPDLPQAQAYMREISDFYSKKELSKIDDHLLEMAQYVKHLEHMAKCAKKSYNIYLKIFEDISSIKAELNPEDSQDLPIFSHK